MSTPTDVTTVMPTLNGTHDTPRTAGDVGVGQSVHSRRLYTYFRSSAAYRVRIALHLKGLQWEAVPIHLLRDGGIQRQPAYTAINPSQLVPSFEEQGQVISQSLAICEYLEERYPAPSLLPTDPFDRARVRQWALMVACDLHPLNNLRVLQYLEGPLGLSAAQKTAWIKHWNEAGLAALEASVSHAGEGRFCLGDTPTLADCCLIPQLFNARRFDIDLTPYPRLRAIEAACEALEAFQAAHPSRQHDAA